MATVNEKMTAIADNIRDKTGGTEALSLDAMASGVNDVYEAGKKSEYDEFWDSIDLNAVSSVSFSGNAWNDKTFKPPRNILFDTHNGNWCFSMNKISSIKTSLAIHGVTIDTSKLNGLSYAFNNMATKDLPVLDLRGIKTFSRLGAGIQNNSNLETIDKIILTDNWSSIGNAANFLINNPKLKNIEFEGIIAGSINFLFSPLTIESLKSIITHLKDYSGTINEFVYTITFKSSAFEVLEAEGATAEYNGTACTWAELIGFLKWNLVKA